MARITNKSKGAKADAGTVYTVQPFTVFESTLYTACADLERAEFATACKGALIVELIRAEYGDTAPTFDQYRALQDALQLQALADGFTGQAMRKHAAAAVKGIYGSLPVSDSPAAILKAKARAIKAKIAKHDAVPAASAAPVGKDTLAGNVAGGTMPHRAGPAESVEQFIARVGITATLNALARILEVDSATKLDAVALRAIVAHVAPMKVAA